MCFVGPPIHDPRRSLGGSGVLGRPMPCGSECLVPEVSTLVITSLEHLLAMDMAQLIPKGSQY